MNNSYDQPEDLLMEESFMEWFHKSNEQSVEFWNKWIAENPAKKDLVEKAVELLLIFGEEKIPAKQQLSAEEKLMGAIAAKQVKVLPIRRSMWWAAAAIFITIVSITFFKSNDKPSKSYTTAYGEVSKKLLPDGSEIILNAHSNVRVKDNWKQGEEREVWIDGEAFFHVKKTANHSSFVVHATHFDVIVTGTKFNVSNRSGNSNIVLEEGRVTIKAKNGNVVYMKPGEFVEYRNNEVIRRDAQVDKVVAWTEQKFVFAKTPLKDVVKLVLEHYDVKVELADSSLADETISGRN